MEGAWELGIYYLAICYLLFCDRSANRNYCTTPPRMIAGIAGHVLRSIGRRHAGAGT
jgi:hypothetical protein